MAWFTFDASQPAPARSRSTQSFKQLQLGGGSSRPPLGKRLSGAGASLLAGASGSGGGSAARGGAEAAHSPSPSSRSLGSAEHAAASAGSQSGAAAIGGGGGRASDLVFNNSNRTVTSSTYDDRVVLGAMGFRRGRHYWEFLVERYENQPDPAFGIATRNVRRDAMLGACVLPTYVPYLDRLKDNIRQ